VIEQAHETARRTDSHSVYEATWGARGGTFYLFIAASRSPI
jgi:hypothetical protein